MSKKVCLITGVSQGLGLEMAQKFLNKGYIVAGTSRDKTKIPKSLTQSDQFLSIEMNLFNEQSIQQAIQTVLDTTGHIDTLINNAGYGLFGAVEEASNDEVKNNYNVNVFGLISVLRSILPSMRKRGSGHIINIASIGGFIGSFPGTGIYCSTKFAVAGITEGLKADLEETGVDVTVVYPGYFRTNFLASSSMKVTTHSINDYKKAHEVVNQHKSGINQNQPGDPKKLAQAVFEATEMTNRPFHLFLGPDAVEYAQFKIKTIQDDLKSYEHLSMRTNFNDI